MSLTVVSGGIPQGVLEALERYQEKPLADSTRRFYASDWAHFEEWCDYRKRRALPAEPATVASYLVEMAAEMSVSTLQRRLLVIRRWHEQQGGAAAPTEAPLVKNAMAHLRRELGTAQKRKAALLLEDLQLAVDAIPDGKTAARDKALLLVGWAAALRRSELGGLHFSDVSFQRQGMLVTIQRSKTDQEGEGQEVGVPLGREAKYCPVKALRAWLAISGIQAGPLFVGIDRHGNLGKKGLSGDAICHIVQESVARIGMDPRYYGGHSLRAGLATSAALNGVDLLTIMRTTRHRSQAVASRYVRAADLFRQNAASLAGL